MTKFWHSTSGKLEFDPNNILNFLKEQGFGVYQGRDLSGSMLVRVNQGIISITNRKEIRKYCFNYLEKYPFSDETERGTVKSSFVKVRFFTDDNLSLLDPIEVNELKDTESHSYLFFKNCIVKITPGTFEKYEYGQIQGNVFEKDIIDFEFEYTPELDLHSYRNDYWQFLEKICFHKDPEVANKMFDSLMTIIGYLTCRYKDPAQSLAIIFSDQNDSGIPNGGTGKSLLARSLGFVRNAVFADGKQWNTNIRFWSSDVDYDTRIMVIDDIPSKFDFEKLFPIITERIVVERKYRDKITIDYRSSPKVVLTSNYVIAGEGFSHERRKLEFPLSNYFGPKRTPETQFGKRMFEGWDKDQWQLFYNTIANAILCYLIRGIVHPPVNIHERNLKVVANPKFIEFMEGHFHPNVKTNKKDFYDAFYSQYPELSKVTLTTFRNWLNLYGKYVGYKLNDTHSGSDNFFEYSKG